MIIPRESRNAYDHAVRAVGAKVIEVDSAAEVEAAIGPRTAMIELLGNHFGSARLDLKDVAPIARKAHVPILVDAAADYLIVPNPYLALGADLVAYSGGKIIRGPQTAGLLVGRRDLVRAAWANSAPHHGFGRGMKVSKEEIVGMVKAIELLHHAADHPGPGSHSRGSPAHSRRSLPDPEHLVGYRENRTDRRRGRTAVARW